MTKLLMTIMLLIGTIVSHSASAIDSQVSHLFVYQNTPDNYGYFLDNRNGTWQESTGDGAFYNFTEVNRTGYEIRLYDASRKLNVILSLSGVYLRFENEGEDRLFKTGIWDNRRVLWGTKEHNTVLFRMSSNRGWHVAWLTEGNVLIDSIDFKEIKRDIGMVEIKNDQYNLDYIILNDGKVLQRGGSWVTDSGYWSDKGPF